MNEHRIFTLHPRTNRPLIHNYCTSPYVKYSNLDSPYGDPCRLCSACVKHDRNQRWRQTRYELDRPGWIWRWARFTPKDGSILPHLFVDGISLFNQRMRYQAKKRFSDYRYEWVIERSKHHKSIHVHILLGFTRHIGKWRIERIAKQLNWTAWEKCPVVSKKPYEEQNRIANYQNKTFRMFQHPGYVQYSQKDGRLRHARNQSQHWGAR